MKISASPFEVIELPRREIMKSIRRCVPLPSGDILVSDANSKILVARPGVAGLEKIAGYRLTRKGDFVDFYTFDDQNRIWFTTREGSLYRLSGGRLVDLSSIVPFHNEQFRGISYDKKRKIVFVCADSVLLSGNESRLDTFFASTPKRFIPLPGVVYVDSSGALLVQSIEDGVFYVSPSGTLRQFEKGMNFFRSAEVMDKTGRQSVWAARQSSDITRYEWDKEISLRPAEQITAAEGLEDNFILDFTVEKNGRLWLATTRGVTVMEKDGWGKWIHQDFEISDGGRAIIPSFPTLSEDANGNMWMNLDDKLILFRKNHTALKPLLTTTIIEKVLLFDRPTNWLRYTDSLDSYRGIPVEPVLQHQQNTISITFNGLLAGDNPSLEYSYRLLPADSNWNTAGSGNIVSFYQLSPGRYRFEVRSRARGFDWSTPANFAFTINKPFWETWLFRIAVILAASAIIILIFRFRLHQLRERSKMQNQVREMELKALKAQMNPHFIHNALNSIQSLIVNNRTHEASHYISKFARLLRQVLENADRNQVSLDRELYSLQLYVELEKLRMNLEFDYTEQIDENIVPANIKIPPLILQPFVENALWHGLSNKIGYKKISLSILEKDGWIICEIEDNGIGRKKAAEKSKTFPEGSLSRAITITSQRLIEFNQSPGIEPVSIIDHYEGDEPRGTTVVVRIRLRPD
jgi:hypothetical protein